MFKKTKTTRSKPTNFVFVELATLALCPLFLNFQCWKIKSDLIGLVLEKQELKNLLVAGRKKRRNCLNGLTE